MLDRSKLMRELQKSSETIFFDLSTEREQAHVAWQRIVNDPAFFYKIKEISTDWLLPDWFGQLDAVTTLNPIIDHYTVVAVDGSQIYPDKHQGTSCSLVNIGTVILSYGTPCARVVLRNEPYVFNDDTMGDELGMSPEWINCTRQEYEFAAGLQVMEQLQNSDSVLPAVFLFDGALIFWHLAAKEHDLKDHFLSCYLTYLQQFYEKKLLLAGYISLPKSKELVNLVRVQLCNFDVNNAHNYPRIDHLVDSSIARFFLKEGQRSILFKSNSPITQSYLDHLKPHFFYLDVGEEIVRIELPAWIAADELCLEQVCRVIVDQCAKGDGYPVCLAEAHEQAVVKGPDRDFFYHLIARFGLEQRRTLIPSRKSMKKRGIAI